MPFGVSHLESLLKRRDQRGKSGKTNGLGMAPLTLPPLYPRNNQNPSLHILITFLFFPTLESKQVSRCFFYKLFIAPNPERLISFF
jgi:hypothetical protein